MMIEGGFGAGIIEQECQRRRCRDDEVYQSVRSQKCQDTNIGECLQCWCPRELGDTGNRTLIVLTIVLYFQNL